MEGLIPLVCRAIKRNKTRRRYECLSSGGGGGGGAALNYEGAFDSCAGDQTQRLSWTAATQQKIAGGVHGDGYKPRLHRRYNSVGDYDSGLWRGNDKAEGRRPPPPPPRHQLVRFGSHRMFSCVTGGA